MQSSPSAQTSLSGWRVLLAALLFLVLGMSESHAQPAPTEFGFGVIPRNGGQTLGQKALLIIYAQFAQPTANGVFRPTLTSDQTRVAYADLFLNINGYFFENSQHKFLWTRFADGFVPVLLSSLEYDPLTSSKKTAPTQMLIALKRAAAVGYDFSRHDLNGDGRVTSDELTVVIVEEVGGISAGGRYFDPGYEFVQNKPTGGSIAIAIDHAIRITNGSPFIAYCHELVHDLGINFELYDDGASNKNYTTLDGSSPGVAYYHLDPWIKMLFGWAAPQIYEITSEGSAVVQAAQLTDHTRGPIILYDPRRGTDEFFVVEFRSSALGGYDANVDQAGITAGKTGVGGVIWHVKTRGIVSIGRTIEGSNLYQFPRGDGSTFVDNSGNTQFVKTNSVFMLGEPKLTRASGNVWPPNTETPAPLRWINTNGQAEGPNLAYVRFGNLSSDGRTLEISWGTRPCIALAAGCGIVEAMSLLVTQ